MIPALTHCQQAAQISEEPISMLALFRDALRSACVSHNTVVSQVMVIVCNARSHRKGRSIIEAIGT